MRVGQRENGRQALLSSRVKPGQEVRRAVLALLPLRELCGSCCCCYQTLHQHTWGRAVLGSNFSSSADEPQIPHGEILIPFFSALLKKQVSDIFLNLLHYIERPFLYLKPRTYFERGKFSIFIQLHFPLCRCSISVCTALVLHTEHVTSWYFVTSSLLDGRSASDPFLPFELCSEEHIPRISPVPL